MTDAPLPQNVYRLAQKEFDAIPGSPWVYWINDNLREIFRRLPKLNDTSPSRQGLATADNFRFLRFWWETGTKAIGFGCKSANESKTRNEKWYPYMKGGSFRRWYGNQDYVINYGRNGYELKSWADPLYRNSGWSRIIKSTDFYFREGVTYSYLTGAVFSARISPGGFIFDVAGSTIFTHDVPMLLAVMNSKFAGFALKLINPTVNFQVGDLARLPIPKESNSRVVFLVTEALHVTKVFNSKVETAYDFVVPPIGGRGLLDPESTHAQLAKIEEMINDGVYRLYGISAVDQRVIQAELDGGFSDIDDSEEPIIEAETINETVQTLDAQQLAIEWISYAIGVVLGRFQPGLANILGSAIYRRSDFAIGSLPAPDDAEFDELVSPAEQFAYVDENGGRHVFSAQVERALQDLALPDGIAIFDEGHPRDLPTLVEKALNLMLGEQAAREVVREATGGNSSTSLSANLRNFLEKDFFTAWHFKWYRKRPIYWPIQSSKRSYGFVIFHEKINHDTFYTIQREPYLDTKRNAVALKMADVQASLARATGTDRKKLERELDELRRLSDELAEFAKDLEAITMGGYEPEPNWIDDGVILRMAPLWKAIPIWKSEPKKYWERLAAGDFDWSHIAMRYWPKRVRDKCKTNKSYAIAHDHEEWYEG